MNPGTLLEPWSRHRMLLARTAIGATVNPVSFAMMWNAYSKDCTHS